MLKAPEGSFLMRERPLSKRMLQKIKMIFAEKIVLLGHINRETRGIDSNWLYNQPNFTHEQMQAMDRILAKVGLKIAKRYANVNSLICYRRVDAHDDTEIPVGAQKMRIDDCSYVFIPLYGHEGGEFIIGEEGSKTSTPIQDGSLIVLDHNVEHEVRFPANNDKLKFGLSFLVDHIIKSPPSASTHPQGQQFPSTPKYPPHEPLDHSRVLSDAEA